MTTATIKTAQRAIDKRHIPLEIVRDSAGYHYFVYDVPAQNAYETVSVYIPYTSHQTAEEWADIAEDVMESIRKKLER